MQAKRLRCEIVCFALTRRAVTLKRAAAAAHVLGGARGWRRAEGATARATQAAVATACTRGRGRGRSRYRGSLDRYWATTDRQRQERQRRVSQGLLQMRGRDVKRLVYQNVRGRPGRSRTSGRNGRRFRSRRSGCTPGPVPGPPAVKPVGQLSRTVTF